MASNLRLNWALAHANYDDQQVSTFQGTGFVVGNAATSTVNTLEMDLLWQATENLRVAASAAWLDPKYDEFLTGACTELQYAYFRGAAGPANVDAPPASRHAPGAKRLRARNQSQRRTAPREKHWASSRGSQAMKLCGNPGGSEGARRRRSFAQLRGASWNSGRCLRVRERRFRSRR